MLRVAYLFERFPSFGQTFCYREVAELERQGAELRVFSIRRPQDEPAQEWESAMVDRVVYLPEEPELVKEIDRAARAGELPSAAVRMLKDWGRETDFLRLYQAAFIGVRLRDAGITRVHAHFAGMAARTAYWLKQFFGIDYSLTAHANDIFAPRDFTISLTRLFDAATAVVTVSDFALEHLRERFPQNAAKFHLIYNGIDVDAFTPAKFDTPVATIVSIGRLIEKKGFADLIRACAQLKANGRDFHCEIIGEGPLEESLRRQIADEQLGDRVHMLGPRTQRDIRVRLAAAKAFVLAAKPATGGDMDNLPTVIMEAMVAGLPVISTNMAGIPEMVQPGVNGILVPPGDIAALAEAIDGAMADRARGCEMGARGRALARAKFSLATNVRALRDLLTCGG